MSDFPFRDLATAAGFAAVAYTLFNALVSFGSGQPLVDWINPHRRNLLPLAGVLVGGAYTLLIRAMYRYHMDLEHLLGRLVHDDQAKPEVIGALSFTMLAAAMVALYFWCRWLFPRDPRTFTPGARDMAAEYRRAMRHYVRWSGQLDYVALCRIDDGRLEKLASVVLPSRVLVARMRRVESMGVPPDAVPAEVADAQVRRWDDLTARVFSEWDRFDTLVLPAKQGGNSLVFFDLQFGGIFIELLPGFRSTGGEVRTFLFAVCVNQAELNAATATRYYAMLSAAIKHIRAGGQKT